MKTERDLPHEADQEFANAIAFSIAWLDCICIYYESVEWKVVGCKCVHNMGNRYVDGLVSEMVCILYNAGRVSKKISGAISYERHILEGNS